MYEVPYAWGGKSQKLKGLKAYVTTTEMQALRRREVRGENEEQRFRPCEGACQGA